MGFLDYVSKRGYKDKQEVDKAYWKRCDAKINELCGGFRTNKRFDEKARRLRHNDRTSNIYEKVILKHECRYGMLKFVDIEDRLDELLQLDCEKLFSIMEDVEPANFKTQKDIDDYLATGKINTHEESVSTKEERIEEERQCRENQRLAKEKRDAEYKLRTHAYGRTLKHNTPKRIVSEFNKMQKEREKEAQIKKEQDEKRKEEFRAEVARKRKEKEALRKISNENKHQNENISNPRPAIPKEKLHLIAMGDADIEVFTKVKSNTTLASTALFLVSGVFVAEAKEEMKWVKTKIVIKEDRIIIKKPYSIHKYKDFTIFKVNQDDNYYLFYIGFRDNSMIHFRTKEKYLGELIVDKINAQGLAYDRTI